MTESRGEVLFEKLLASLETSVIAQGFKRRKRLFRSVSDGNAALIEVQKSENSSAERIVFTINLGVVCGKLLDPERVELNKAGIIYAHLRTRLGMLLDEPVDRWWELTASTDFDLLKEDLVTLLCQKAIPYLSVYLKTDALVALWQSGRSPGLTVTQRSRYLAELANDASNSSQ